MTANAFRGSRCRWAFLASNFPYFFLVLLNLLSHKHKGDGFCRSYTAEVRNLWSVEERRTTRQSKEVWIQRQALLPWTSQSEALCLSIPHLGDGAKISTPTLREEWARLHMECTAWGLAPGRSSGFWGPGEHGVSKSMFVCNRQALEGRGSSLFKFTLVYFSQQPGTLLWAYHGTAQISQKNWEPLASSGRRKLKHLVGGLRAKIQISCLQVQSWRLKTLFLHPVATHKRTRNVWVCQVPIWLATNDQVFKMEIK